MSLTRFTQGDTVVSTDTLVTSTWTNNTNNLTTAFTSSANNFGSSTSSGQFYLEVYQTESTDTKAEVQYAVSYGNRAGSGSPDFTNDSGSMGLNAARVIYGQYSNLVFGDETQNFTFDTHVPEDIFVINVNRARYKHKLKPGTLNLKISASLPQDAGTSQFDIQLTDDSVTKDGSAKLTNLGRQFNIVSGASGVMSGSLLGQTKSGSYGLFYPDAGILILNPDSFGGGDTNSYPMPVRTQGNSGSDEQRNPEKLYQAISNSGHFILDSEEKVTSQYYFARAKNFEYNYTTNPSFIDNSGNLNFSSMINNPRTYISTVGLYNDNNDLVAVAKLSQPVTKDFTKEALIRVKLDY